MNAGFADVDAYIAAQPEEARATLTTLRGMITAMQPDAVESISYGMPTYKYRGKPLVYFAAAKRHCALYGMDVEGHKQMLAGYDAEKGTIRFPHGRPPSEELLRILLEARTAAIDASMART